MRNLCHGAQRTRISLLVRLVPHAACDRIQAARKELQAAGQPKMPEGDTGDDVADTIFYLNDKRHEVSTG